MNKNKISKIIIHWSASSSKTTVEDIRRWHLANKWANIGYHRVILHPASLDMVPNLLTWSDLVKIGRPTDNDAFLTSVEQGAHTKGFNKDSFAICVIGNTDYKLHDLQKVALVESIKVLLKRFNLKSEDVYGHRDFNTTLCPGNEVYQIIQQIKGGNLIA